MSETREETAEVRVPLGRFLVSFVLLPGAIVLVGLAVVVGLRWIVFSETGPDQLVETIERREGNTRWRAAVQLAGLLADPNHAAVRSDRQLAGRLTDILHRELQAGGAGNGDAALQIYLCRALGEFESDVSLPVLVQASSSRYDGAVRRSAIEAIALLAGTLGSERVGTEPGLADSLLAASRDSDWQIRLSAAYALGVLGGDEAEERLTAMLLDERTLVRYNAATGLARWGNAAAVGVLLEMLAPDQQAVIGSSPGGTPASVQQDLIHVNALEAARQLLAVNSEVSGEPFRAAMERLSETTSSQAVRKKIEELLKPVLARSS